ncbi:MAG: hypothetical protein QXY45_02425 [Candidatus Aenigmatarchaeota archaeon]
MKIFLTIVLIFGIIFIISGCTSLNNRGIDIIDFRTDKDTYSSFEEIRISLLIKSSGNFQDVQVNVLGIKPRQYYYINESKIINLTKGYNEISFISKTPHCTSGCGGVYPGPYNITSEVLLNGKFVCNKTIQINLISK